MIYTVLLIGLGLRLISVNQSLWLDEATSALVAKMSIGDMFTRFLPGDFHPPLYYLILKFWASIFGNSEISLRIPSVVFGVATVYVTYLIAKKLFNQKIGLIASFFLATSGLAIYYSQEARMYSLAALLISCLVYMFLERKWLLFSLTLALIGMTDYVSLFIVPVFLIVGWGNIKKVILSFIPLLTVFLFWSPIFIKQLSGGLSVQGSAWWGILGQPTLKNFLLVPIKFILGRISLDNRWLYGVVVVLLFYLFGYLLWRARMAGKLLWLWLVLPVGLEILVSLKIPMLSYFRFLFVLPALYILVGKGIENSRKYRRFFLCLVMGVNLVTTICYLLTPKFQREDWRGAASAIGEDKIVFPAATQKEALIYYGKGEQIINTSQISLRDKEIWLSRYVWEIFDSDDSAKKSVEALGYNKTSEYNFNGVVFWKYGK